MSRNYILNEQGEPVATNDLNVWARFFELPTRIVKQEDIGRLKVSTVFLSMDHNFGGGPPVLWETMVFDEGSEIAVNRCAGSREQATAMHAEMVNRVNNGEFNET
jgi:hypothetical protein